MRGFAFHPEARLEYLAAVDYYEGRREGLGARFTLEIEKAIGQIVEAPERWPVFGKDVRRCVTRVFPFAVVYSVEGETVWLLAVMHCSRRPGYWRERRVPRGEWGGEEGSGVTDRRR